MDNQELIRENTLLRQKIQELEHLKVECKQMEKAIRESEERYSMLSQSSFEGIIISEKGMILDANDQLTNMLGYELSDLIGRDGFDLILPERRESFRQHILSGKHWASTTEVSEALYVNRKISINTISPHLA